MSVIFENSFFFFTVLMVFFAFQVINSKNPLHSILYLILIFFNFALLLLFQRVEFLSFIILIIYVGAIAVLFLFVIYMLNIKLIELHELNFMHVVGIFLSICILFYFYVYYHILSLENLYTHFSKNIFNSFLCLPD